jgi:phosphatidylglycerophosphatase A
VLWLTPSTWLWQLIAFGLFRFFDIVKPGGIKKIDSTIKGGIGVMVDDLVAAAYTLLVIAILVQVGERL